MKYKLSSDKKFGIFAFFFLAICLYGLWRNNEVLHYSLNIMDRRSYYWRKYAKEVQYRDPEYTRIKDTAERIYVFKPSYQRMLLSFKPLEDKYWLDEDMCSFLDGTFLDEPEN